MTPEQQDVHDHIVAWFKSNEGEDFLTQKIEERLGLYSRTASIIAKFSRDVGQLQSTVTEQITLVRRAVGRMRRIATWGLLQPFLVAGLIFLILIGAGEGYLYWNQRRFQESVARSLLIQQENQELLEEAERIRNGVFGVAVTRQDDQCFILLPNSADVETFWTVRGRRATEVDCPPPGAGE